MSRNHSRNNGGQKIVLQSRAQVPVIKAMQHTFVNMYEKEMYHAATVCIYLITYMADEMETLNEVLDGDNCPFTMRLRNRVGAVVRECHNFIDMFEPQINPDSKQEWIESYSQFQIGMQNYFIKENGYENEGSSGSEICRASALRYHDPHETNPQRIFQDGFKKGAQYADLHPAGTLTVKRNGKEETFQMKDVVDTFVKAKFGDSIEVSCVMKRTEECK